MKEMNRRGIPGRLQDELPLFLRNVLTHRITQQERPVRFYISNWCKIVSRDLLRYNTAGKPIMSQGYPDAVNPMINYKGY